MIIAYCDGCCEPVNPGGTASFGVVIFREGEEIYRASKVFFPQKGRERETSNNVAEYSGLKEILTWLIEHGLTGEEIQIKSDSMLVVKQMIGSWRIKQGFYVPIARECQELLKHFTCVRMTWIPREENTLADKLSKAELIKAGVKFRIQPE